MKRVLPLAVAIVLAAGWVVPGALGMAVALHADSDHTHAEPVSADAMESMLHGHLHDSGEPAHSHSVQLLSAAPYLSRANGATALPAWHIGSIQDSHAGRGPVSDGRPSGAFPSAPLPLLLCTLLT
ncbi:MAG: hypothetical protein AB1625_12565 [Acidobacteriota bacterium]